MNFGIFSGGFWGVMLIIGGILVLIKNIFNLSIPVFKILLGIFFIYLGFSMLTNIVGSSTNRDIIFNNGSINAGDENEYNIIFGSGVIDLSGMTVESARKNFETNIIFSSGKLIINPDLPVLVRASSVFASAKFPDERSVVFGDMNYKTKGYIEGGDNIIIDANVVFGNLEIEEKSVLQKDTAGAIE